MFVVSSTCNNLNKTIDTLTNDLVQERKTVGNLDKQLQEAKASNQAYIDGLQSMPATIINELMKQDGVVPTLIAAGDNTQTK